MSVLTLEAKLERADPATPWGFRMQGGKEFNSPLTIQRVNPGSLAAKCGLQAGDIILKIGAAGSDTFRHKDAQDAIVHSGNKLDLLLQRGGKAPSYDKFSTPSYAPSDFIQQPSPQFTQNYNPTPKPFGSTQSQPQQNAPYGSTGVDNLSNQTKNLNISSKEPYYAPSFEKYTEQDDKHDSSQNQSKSFKFLQNLMDTGKEPPSALRPLPQHTRQGSSPRSTSPVIPYQPPPPEKPTVTAIVNKQYNTPIGIYSDNTALNQAQGQTPPPSQPQSTPPWKREVEVTPVNIDRPSNGTVQGKKVYIPSETYKLIKEQEENKIPEPQDSQATHSRSFRLLQNQLNDDKNGPSAASSAPSAPPPALAPSSGSKPSTWAPPKPSAAPVSAPKPWAPSAPVGAPPGGPTGGRPRGPPARPTGVGATRGKKGDAVVKTDIGRIPICASCGGQIRGPFVVAMGKTWCPDHFTCSNPQCGKKLLDIGFVEEGGQIYCEKDYEMYFAPHCAKCGGAVVGECVNALQKQWHPNCFICSHCHQPIGGTEFHVEDGKPFCNADWAKLFQSMCSGCNFPIEPGDQWVEAMNQNYHSGCFNCSTCQVSLEGQPFVPKGGKPYCRKHAR